MRRESAVRSLCDSVIELHGDRATGDDASLQAGLAWIDAYRCAFLFTSEPALSSAAARKCRRVIAVAESIGVPVVAGGAFPLAYHRLPADEPAAIQACSELCEAMASVGVPIVALIQDDHDASTLLPFDIVVHDSTTTCAHPTGVENQGERDEDRRSALIEALARAAATPREELVDARARRVRIVPEPA